ncbi:MAG: mitochondrial branched-chain alpha-ketoacid dehydrogenase kinase-domain-containing protein [Benniella sp.]|nr:MAG: mitochondrial branched-chain alpha-ketoacid dehydrogenase kinase-domain-containing protein [Benniella sp.]
MYRITPQLADKIKHFATFPQTGVSLRQMVMFGQNPTQGTLFKASQFLAEELPIRLAHRVKELEELPHNLSDMPSIIRVKNWYAQSFQDLVEFPAREMTPALKEIIKGMNKQADMQALPENSPNLAMPNGGAQSGRRGVSLSHRYHSAMDGAEWPAEMHKYNEKFTKMIEAVKRRHDPVVTTVAQGILEFKQSKKSHNVDTDVQAFLDRFYMSRIGIRMLIGQHIALNKGPSRKDYVGIICTKTNLADMAQEAIDNAKFICEDYYGLFRGPEVHLHCKKDLEFMYVPSHLSHMLFELLKNSLRAVVEQYGTECEDYPPIKLIVAQGKEDIAIKISDEGGGIPRSGVPLVWTYMYTTAPEQNLDPTFDKSDFKAPMAGFGYGLPISRLYARYFGGDLKLISMEGYGTDVYLHLNRISNSDEPLP